ncbi:hypothetical protein WDJ51_09940 [Rathayibacter sp. YIM 133350]|uniref:hypothetical protein n=1 Tax=Rathayibacter sp. YIM 133350 TaxID=3131992 RepID=UPI00307E56FD
MSDLTGGPDERTRQLAQRASEGELDAAWLRRQLDSALAAWGDDESKLDVEKDARQDY